MSDPKEVPPKGDVLIVDDNPSNLSLLSAMLVERGYEVRAAINGAMALKAANAAPPDVILLAGVNGAGKTTTIAKLTRLFQSQGKTVLLAAGDTFRAAAVEQLAEWGRRHDVTVVHTGV